MLVRAALLALALYQGVTANPFSSNLYPRAACSGNTATTRNEWCDYSIDTDYTVEGPTTGVTREFWLDLTDVTVAPDGYSRPAMAINGSIPGPTLIVDWGDEVIVHVTNSLTTSSSNNGTSIHFHGIRQNYTNQYDGVSSITQCPTAPGQSTTYRWKAVQYGSTWYHSHFSLQAWEGVFGGIIINGPATANYDVDLGTLMLNDWSYGTVDNWWDYAQENGPVPMDTGLINGTMVSEYGGFYYNTTVTAGSKYRLRIVNGAVDSHFKFSIDNHTMQVIGSDLVPIQPYDATVVGIGMGQRYDLIITADQADVADNFWIRAVPQSACSGSNALQDDIRGILAYTSTVSTPSTSNWDFGDDECLDETDNIIPYITKTVPENATITTSESVDFTQPAGLFKWTLNSTSLLTDWGVPTLYKIENNDTSFTTSEAVIELPNADEWFIMVIDTDQGVTHPIHLHGHDFFVLAQGATTYDASTVTLNLDNPPRRDTALLYSQGYLVIGWQTDNPGIWLMHCHIGWHMSEGFAVQFLERASEIPGITDASYVEDLCTSWNAWQDGQSLIQDDSGI